MSQAVSELVSLDPATREIEHVLKAYGLSGGQDYAGEIGIKAFESGGASG